ncbi:SGNH/GDSL hydrolase family protein [Aminipila butyrica]|uniref:SGNH/GDSL hydrolase family protein n=1 Tax=Aminipila butyrica TaxID=433296 RepID=A0A858BTU8_9FIRM|nr:SGNH/GDSL hydrolase family protein [Aminipila butyrica]QIB68772.1 SGNH/GDSL hydrolase family protein [Aminipila butyrica]
MKKRYVSIVISILLVTSGLYGCGNKAVSFDTSNPEEKASISQIFAFGDSFSDNGGSLKVSTEVMNLPTPITGASILPCDPQSDLYWEGRWSNGKTAVEYLASELDVKLTNYAVGGAKSGKDNYYDWLNSYKKTGVLSQIDWFKSSLKNGKADSDALYFIFVSANDYFYHMDYNTPDSIKELSAQTVKNINTAVTTLSKLGAKKFMLVSCVDLSIEPWEVSNSRIAQAEEYTTNVNTALSGGLNDLMDKLNVDIIYFDYPKEVSQEIRTNPDQYGIKELNKPYEFTSPEIVKSEGNPEEYYFWDEWHPTTTVHKIAGEEMAEEIEQ